jgi:hypothetical protein
LSSDGVISSIIIMNRGFLTYLRAKSSIVIL